MIKGTGQDGSKENGQAGTILPLIPTRDIVIFPHMTVPLFLGRSKSIKAVEEASAHKTQLFLTAQRDASVNDPTQEQGYPVGTLASIAGQVYLPDGSLKLLVTGERRGRLIRYLSHNDFLQAEVEEIEEKCEQTSEMNQLAMTLLSRFPRYLQHQQKEFSLAATAPMNSEYLSHFIDTVIPELKLNPEKQQQLLEIIDPTERLKNLLELIRIEPNEEAHAKQAIQRNAEKVLQQADCEQVKDVVCAYFAGWWTRDISQLLATVTDDFIFDERPMTMVESRNGKEQFQEYLIQFFAAFPDVTKVITDIRASENWVWVEWLMKGTHQGAFRKISPTQNSITVRGSSMFVVQDGKVSSERPYWDTRDLMRQLGREI